MDRHVTRRILHGLGANAYGQLVAVVIQLAGVPILLHAWGTQLYGEWLILAAIPTYLLMADLGFSQSAGNDMTARSVREAARCRARTMIGERRRGFADLARQAAHVPFLPPS
ncbi:hypothetical protein [Metallibacterium scheffleri]|uniref:Uncharacterized protein n=1 Tax=Metallibacterium scheffleri TaxID=993689 RepID=A0A4S3KLE6_9GAMM|nr:hypothetical protein [Metallibacterium scheffleri]THD09540.1 hypothetical protein B1806_10755 [Metallibacterium scheffleri]